MADKRPIEQRVADHENRIEHIESVDIYGQGLSHLKKEVKRNDEETS